MPHFVLKKFLGRFLLIVQALTLVSYSFIKINNDVISSSTPVESISSQEAALLEDDNKRLDQRENPRKNAIIAGVLVAGGAIFLAAVMIGGALIATNVGSSKYQIKSLLVYPTHIYSAVQLEFNKSLVMMEKDTFQWVAKKQFVKF